MKKKKRGHFGIFRGGEESHWQIEIWTNINLVGN
jgi:hypothetical protein